MVNERKTSAFSNGLLWFGAGISIAEILTGMLLAPLGFARALEAIILGHIIGGIIMYLAGLIGGRTGGSAMETVRISFGTQGAKLFAGLNVIQLVGWTAVMVGSAALAANTIAAIGMSWWSIIIGAFIALWIIMGLKNLSKVNVVVMAALFILTIMLSMVVFQNGTPTVPAGELTFGGAVELAVAMPLSWLPIISDYTRTAKKPVLATAASCGAYFVASSWMFIIGMGAALFTGQDDIAAIMLQAGMGIAGILVVLLSTVTTTFLDAFSAGVSFQSLAPKASDKIMALAATVLGVVLAVFAAPEQFQDFLYLIGSVFAPMTAILLADFFILKRDHTAESVNWLNIVLWVLGVILYRYLLSVDTPVGITVPVVVIIMILSTIIHKVVKV
ncbi:putative hydroxymethylpyrimidine transporter CytX [Megasphaera massiliensis]|uniref:putative hydroxymethylpyrimidine transporter CytX n=1 Tax=Megasphaera massiliensis TaxID=1232428 RepID=UPI00040FC6B5|nr:putative hydroxymethylpyrimidine transporter CytX [Megasphaera massiliensis]MBS6256748.1 putative hydroxymethylpyrimidine transporter CytX [Megasphaera sp.]MCQ5211423.1 putative hydroxymethylpyrimidine transporter CytX [Megasphaera massiliensis]MEE0659187.1 putative hydroxymethylpyrimidine transporter CytX [Megasphaera massiliensis]